MAFVKIARVNEIPPGQVKIVQVDGEDVALCNVDGQIYAIADVCTHDDGPLGQGCLHGNQIECPRHGARLDVRTGQALSLPAVVPVPTFAVKIKENHIFVDIDT